VTPRGKIYFLTQLDKKNILDKLLNRNVDARGDFVDAIYKCTGCGNCEEVCHAGLELVSFWEKIRAWLVDCGIGPLPKHTDLIERINAKRNPYDEDPEARDAWWPEDVKREKIPDVIMFAGCTGSYRMKDIPRAGVRVMDRAGVKQNCLGRDEYCCTSPALRTGELTLTKKAAETVVNKSDAMGAKDMVMTCSGCFKTVSTDFGNHFARTSQNVYHFTEYVEKLIAGRKLPFNNPINAKVTYHDPCHLGRHSGVFDAPRNILKKIKGVQFIEMDKTRENSRCCGAGGGYRSAFTDFAVNIAAERIRDAEAVGAEIIATACPFCVLNLNSGAKKIGSKVKVMDISEMLLKVTGPVEQKPAPAPAPAPPKAEPVPAKVEAVPVPAPVPVKAEPVPAPAVAPAPAPAPVKAVPAPAPAKVETTAVVAKPEVVTAVAVVAMPAPPAPVHDDDGERDAYKEAEEETDDDVLKEETAQDSGELRLRRKLWRRGYRYRKKYGSKKITIAFLKAKVAVFVSESASARDKDDDEALKTAGWTVLRFKDSSIKDANKEADRIIAAIENNLNALMNEETVSKGKVDVDSDVFGEEKDDDPADLKLRRILWRNSYRYRRKYGREKITVAFRRAKVGAFVCADAYKRRGDEQLVKRGWTIMRFKESNITDAKKEAAKVMAAVDRNLYLLSKGVIPEGANITGSDVLDRDAEENTPEYRLRMALWRTHRYRRHYGEQNIDIAYPSSKVAVFVDDSGEKRASDRLLENDGWAVFRFKGANISDGRKEADKIIAAIGTNKEAMEDLDFEEGGSDDEEDLSYLLDDTPEGRVRRAVWNKRIRYRRNYSRYKIDMAFVKFKVAVFFDDHGKPKAADDPLTAKGWVVMRIKVPDITDGADEAARIHKAVKEAKKATRKKKKKPAKKKA
jgi:Fe-S oxidoreductase/very-short-patch-repair endonuclease